MPLQKLLLIDYSAKLKFLLDRTRWPSHEQVL